MASWLWAPRKAFPACVVAMPWVLLPPNPPREVECPLRSGSAAAAAPPPPAPPTGCRPTAAPRGAVGRPVGAGVLAAKTERSAVRRRGREGSKSGRRTIYG